MHRVVISRTYPLLGALAVALLGATACSPTQFFGGGDEPKLATYRAVNEECAKLDLSGKKLGAPALRGIVKCLNRDGAMNATEAWLGSVDDRALTSWIETANAYVFANPSRLWGIERAHSALTRAGLLDPMLEPMGRALADPRWVTGAIDLLAPIFAEDPELAFAALEKIGGALDARSIGKDLRLALSLAEARAFGALQARLHSSSGERSYETLVEDARRLLTAEIAAHEGHVAVLPELGRALESGRLAKSLDALVGANEAETAAKVPGLSEAFRALGENGARIFTGVAGLTSEMNRPLKCLRGGLVVANGNEHSMRELLARPSADAGWFLQRENLLALMALKPFCDYPASLPVYYSSMFELAAKPAIVPTADGLRAFWDSGEGKLLIDLLSETGAHWSRDLAPFLSELSAREAWGDLLLALGAADSASMSRAGSLIRFAAEPDAGLGGRSLLEVLSLALRSSKPEALHDLALGLRALSQSPQPVASPLLRGLWSGYAITSTHPWVETLSSLLSESRANAVTRESVDAFFRHARGPGFRAMLDEVSAMAADGRLKQLIGAGVTLSHRLALRGKHEIEESQDRARKPPKRALRHDLVAGDLAPFAAIVDSRALSPSCSKVDLSQSLAELEGARAAESAAQWEHSLSCLATGPVDHARIAEGLSFLLNEKTESGRSFLAMQVDLVKRNPWSGEEIEALYRRMVSALDSGALERSMEIARHWIGTATTGAGAVLRPALQMLGETMGRGRAQARLLQTHLASWLKRPDFPELVRELRVAGEAAADVFREQGRPFLKPSNPPEAAFDRIKRWVGNKECKLITATTATEWERAKNLRALEVLQEYRDGLTNWELVNGKPRMAFGEAERRELLRELLERMADPARSDASSPLSGALPRIAEHLKQLAGERGMSPGTYFADWVQSRSNDWELTRYFYPEEKNPRVRLLNSLDRLELVLLNNDFKAPGIPPRNFALKFAEDLAEAWGDEDPSRWPKMIRELYPPGSGKRPKTLAEVVKDIEKAQRKFEKLAGFPDMPKCKNKEGGPEDTEDPDSPGLELPSWLPGPIEEMKAGLFHNRQILHVLKQNLPGSGHRHEGGLKLLRAVLYEFHASTPAGDRGSNDLRKNNLAVALKLARAGALRQLGRQGWRLKERDPEVAGAIDRIIRALTSPAVSSWFLSLPAPLLTALDLTDSVDPLASYSASGESGSAFGLAATAFSEQVKRLEADPRYEALRSEDVREGLWEFLAEQSPDPRLRSASRKLRLELARELDSGEIEQYLLLIQRKPDKFYRLLEGLALSAERGEPVEILRILRRSVP